MTFPEEAYGIFRTNIWNIPMKLYMCESYRLEMGDFPSKVKNSKKLYNYKIAPRHKACGYGLD